MSHYIHDMFAPAIENTMTARYVTEKLFHALDVGTVPIYFGAPNVLDLVPPNLIILASNFNILASNFNSMEDLVAYVKEVAQYFRAVRIVSRVEALWRAGQLSP